MKLEPEIKDAVLMTGDIIGGKIMLGIIRAVMWTNGAMLLVTTGDYAIVSRWKAMLEKPRGAMSSSNSRSVCWSGCRQQLLFNKFG